MAEPPAWLRCSPIRYTHLGCSLFNPLFMETKLMTNGTLFNFTRLLLAIQMINMLAYIINLLLDCVKPTIHTLLKGIHIIFDEAVEFECLFIIHAN